MSMLFTGRAAGHEELPGTKQRFAGELGPSIEPVEWNPWEGESAWEGNQQTEHTSGLPAKLFTRWVKDEWR